MNIIKKLFSILKNNKEDKKEKKNNKLSIEQIAEHEAAHGIVWSLFKDNWTVKTLTIENKDLPDKEMNGALHISANFNVETETNIERANEIFAISLAGMIGQNMRIIMQRPNILFEITQIKDYKELFDLSGCSGDFEILQQYSPFLSQEFNVSKEAFTKYKIMDLISLFQNDNKVQYLHGQLSKLLLEKRTLTQNELVAFFEKHNFFEYIYEEGLDIIFYHQRK